MTKQRPEPTVAKLPYKHAVAYNRGGLDLGGRGPYGGGGGGGGAPVWAHRAFAQRILELGEARTSEPTGVRPKNKPIKAFKRIVAPGAEGEQNV